MMIEVGALVHVQDSNTSWIDATVVQMLGENTIEVCLDDKTVKKVKSNEVKLRNPDKLLMTYNVTHLPHIHEPAVLCTIIQRYQKDFIYTLSGSVLIAINPYKTLPDHFYNDKCVQQYHLQEELGDIPPHVFSIAEQAYRSLKRDRRSQSILVSGESGSGKTETTKYILQYLAEVSQHLNDNNDSNSNSIRNKIIQSTPILEAFGNARTLRNDNSSRFGKFIRVKFDDKLNIQGGEISTYLLEKSRIIKQPKGERNFHIFYQLMGGLSSNKKQQLLNGQQLGTFNYLEGEVSQLDTKNFNETSKALISMGIDSDEQDTMFKYLFAILFLGNIMFQKIDDDHCKIVDTKSLTIVCELLGIEEEELKKTLTSRNITTGNEKISVPLRADQAEGCRDSLAMMLYGRLFEWTVNRINENLADAATTSLSISVLDIYGFEDFTTNDFEQFCINWANEKLQQQFYHFLFKLAKEEYQREGVDWSDIQFNDNQDCLDLIEQLPLCIVKILDEESSLAKADSNSLITKLEKHHSSHRKFKKPKGNDTVFEVDHYVHSVRYQVAKFIQKNKDFLVTDQVDILSKSKFSFVSAIFARGGDIENKKSFKFNSVSSQFKISLNNLMNHISATDPHYIRCVKPNEQKKASSIATDYILKQLKYSGVMEAIRIYVEGYPSRLLFNNFLDRYWLVDVECRNREEKQSCSLILQKAIEPHQYKVGNSKVFLRSGQIEQLEQCRRDVITASVIQIQSQTIQLPESDKFKIRTMEVHKMIATSCTSILCLKRGIEMNDTVRLSSLLRCEVSRKEYLNMHQTVAIVQSTFQMTTVQSFSHQPILILQALTRKRYSQTGYESRLNRYLYEELLNNQLCELEGQYGETRLEVLQLKDMCTLIQSNYEQSKNEVKSLSERIQALEQDNSSLRGERDTTNDLILQKNYEIAGLQSTLEEKEQQIISLRLQLGEYKTNMETNSGDMKQLEINLDQLISEMSSLKILNNSLKKELQHTKQDQEEIKNELEDKKKELINYREKLTLIQSERKEPFVQSSQKQQDIKSEDEKVERISEELSVMQRTYKSIIDEKEKLISQLEEDNCNLKLDIEHWNSRTMATESKLRDQMSSAHEKKIRDLESVQMTELRNYQTRMEELEHEYSVVSNQLKCQTFSDSLWKSRYLRKCRKLRRLQQTMNIESTDTKEQETSRSDEESSSSNSCDSGNSDVDSFSNETISSEQPSTWKQLEEVITQLSNGDRQTQIERFIVFLLFEVDRKKLHATSVAQIMLYLVQDSIDRGLQLKKVLHMVEKSFLAVIGCADDKDIPYWLAVVVFILQFFTSDHFLGRVEQIASVGLSSASITEIIGAIFSAQDMYQPFDHVVMTEILMEELDENSAVIKFLQKMAVITMSTYTEVVLRFSSSSDISAYSLVVSLNQLQIPTELCHQIEAQVLGCRRAQGVPLPGKTSNGVRPINQSIKVLPAEILSLDTSIPYETLVTLTTVEPLLQKLQDSNL